MLLEAFFLILVDVPSLELTNIIFILLDICLCFLSILILPEEFLHIFTLLLHCKMLKKGNKHTHDRPNSWRISGINKLFGPEIKHYQDGVEDHAKALGGDHEAVVDPDGHEGPDEVIQGIHGRHW